MTNETLIQVNSHINSLTRSHKATFNPNNKVLKVKRGSLTLHTSGQVEYLKRFCHVCFVDNLK